jgi:hypothetical protein
LLKVRREGGGRREEGAEKEPAIVRKLEESLQTM